MQAHVEVLVADGLLDGDPELLGYVFWAGLHGLVVLQLAGKLRSAPDFAVLQETMARLFARGAAPPAAAAIHRNDLRRRSS